MASSTDKPHVIIVKENRMMSTTFTQVSSQDAPPEKRGDLADLARAFAPFLRGQKSVILQTNGPDKDPINGAITTAQRLAAVFENSPLAAPLQQDSPRIFERVELMCDLRPIHSAIIFARADKTIYVHKPTFVPTLGDVEDHAVKAFGHMLHEQLPSTRRATFDSSCGRFPFPAELFARTFSAWIRYLALGDRTELNMTDLIGTRRQAAERNTIVMVEATRYISP